MYFFLGLVAGTGRGAVDTASFRGRPRGRLSVGAGLPVGVAPVLPGGGDDPLSEVSRLLSSDDILREKNTVVCHTNNTETSCKSLTCNLQITLIKQCYHVSKCYQ